MDGNKYESTLQASFLDAALKRSQFLSDNDAAAANLEYDRLHEIKNELRNLPDRGEAILKRIAQHSDLHVRTLAAASLLAVDENFALRELDRIAALGEGLRSSTAELTAAEWRAGNLREHWR